MKEGAKATGEAWRDNYRTPDYILECVGHMFGSDYFDPCPVNPQFDGLQVRTPGNKFFNPPFSQYKKWVEHWADQPGEQIWISHTNNSTGWYKQLLSKASGLCLLAKRVIFIDPRTGEPCENSSYGKSQSVIYIGSRPEEFVKVFSALGFAINLTKGTKSDD